MRSTPEQKQAALSLARTGIYYCAEIARAVNMRHQTVQDICDRRGIKLPLGFDLSKRYGKGKRGKANNPSITKSKSHLTGARSV